MSGLSSGAEYHFAVKTRDEADNWSLLSNVVVSSTLQNNSLFAVTNELLTDQMFLWPVTGDFNGDGVADFAALDYGRDVVTVLAGNGGGGFSMLREFPSSTIWFVLPPLVAADFDGDGVDELVSSQDSETVLYDDISVSGVSSRILLTHDTSCGLLAADIDGDDDKDLLVSEHYFGLRIYINHNGTFQQPPILHEDTQICWTTAAADLDQDGVSEFLLFNCDPYALKAYEYYDPEDIRFKYSVNEQNTGFLQIADVNADGYPDAMAILGGVHLYINDRTGLLTYAGQQTFYMTSSVAVDDLDLDGDLDLAIAQWARDDETVDEELEIWYNDGTGSFSYQAGFYLFGKLPGSGVWTGVVAADIDGDGDKDLIAVGPEGARVLTNLTR
ncbi:MAG: VCBS repeat-containing protein [bacterium]|nr:VCBS repeat-containing protein [bacterium]